MKTIYSTILLLFLSHFILGESIICPDPPENDSPCINSSTPPTDVSDGNVYTGTTCCATPDLENVSCNNSTTASVWYYYMPNSNDEGYTIQIGSTENGAEGPMSVEVYKGALEQGCSGSFTETLIFSCVDTEVSLSIGNCFAQDEVIFIKVVTSDAEESCGAFEINVSPSENSISANECLDLADFTPITPVTSEEFSVNYVCASGSLDFACPASAALGGCEEFTNMPTVWFKVEADDLAQRLYTTVETNGNWEPIWSIYSGTDCNDLELNIFGAGATPCSNDDNTPLVHNAQVFTGQRDFWIMVTADPNSIASNGIGDASFEFCASTTINAIICLGDLDEGACDDESLVMEITDRNNSELPLEGPFCQGEEVTVNISMFYDATATGADWLIGFVPKFGKGWDMESFDFDANAPRANGQIGQWYEEGSEVAPIIQEPVSTLCTYRDEEGILQICNQLCEPCLECEEQGLVEGDPLPSGYFWVSNGGNEGCENDGSPGEGWGIGSVTAQIDWTFTLRVKTFETEDACFDNNDLSISFQTFSDGVAGCWEDPVGECLLDKSMVSPPWRIGCTEVPPSIVAESIEICNDESFTIPVSTIDGSALTILVEAQDNPNIIGADDFIFENGFGEINDILFNIGTSDEVLVYEVYAVDPDLICQGPRTKVEVLVYSEAVEELDEAVVCSCEEGCTTIGVSPIEGATYAWDTGETTDSITVCPTEPTQYTVTLTLPNGCVKFGSVQVDCEGNIDACYIPQEYKLITDFYVDANNNGVRDSSDISYAGGSYFVEPDGSLYYNTSIEEDALILEEGEYSLSYNPGNLDCWALTSDSMVTIDLDSATNCTKIEFGLFPIVSKRDIQVSHYLATRCNSDQFFHLIVENEGTSFESGVMWAELDENVLPFNFPNNATIDTFIAPNKVGWYFENLLPGDKTSRTVRVHIPGPPDFPIGDEVSHTIYTELENEDGTYELWGEREVSGIVLCAYDPNDKAVEPGHPEGYTNLDEEKLIYKVRFQNTGNAPAENIEIRDTLSEFLDVSTLEYIIGSHDRFLTLSREGERVLVFTLTGVYLPDSTLDLEGSQGFFLFKVDLVEGLPEGTIIENSAHIYFDRNPPIVTNTTQNILYPDLDEDGYFSIEDCDEENENINPGAPEIPNNDIDEDCDGVALIIDNDMDGFNSDEDCNDEDAAINPDAEEIPNNDVDENCDNLIIIFDEDMDGFNSDDDCDDTNADINPDAEEIPNNDVDEDCDGEALVIDNDMDGFNSDEDCDDENADINPDAEEIPNNDVDEDCDGEALVIDNDMDGFNSDEDCDDENSEINPDAEDIPNNGIDEDCDGVDAVIDNVNEADGLAVKISPNPSNDVFNVELQEQNTTSYRIIDVVGRVIQSGTIQGKEFTLQLEEETNGLYLLILTDKEKERYSFHRLIKI
ncbi:MAG: MopE-related protein [Saprospiraceae bacterium]|nr:MopE-related protein [Saprospiraceae bacterium]